MSEILNKDPFEILQVIDRLEVGPIKLEKKRVVTPYTVIQGDKQETTELIYSYEEDVFDPAQPESQNLASMITAQVAMNYGLFCKEIIFHGVYDSLDCRFITKMSENTAREIFVNKILAPNVFLTGDAKKISEIKQFATKQFLQAKLSFPEATKKHNWKLWETNKNYHGVLSSGGKDSLLSYGLLNEIGHETHSIFLNESGKHWFTALNAYRHFKDNVPNTYRVWVNSDRVFAWMLRHLPFIRPDFAKVRSDGYPIRLWTVAVFLFGALPIMRKKNIGRLLIGDEFDTTVKTTTAGITHYDGLYDQSRYFDNAMSQYYMKKGWSMSQFSVLRPLSEMLIEKILVERYPDLQKHQMSCHATHEEKGRIRPCGRCEKCRRIVGMLMALRRSPTNCGYTETEIGDCLKELQEKGVHQESAGQEQLLFMLNEIGVIDNKKGKEHKEVMNLRFDQEHSPGHEIPVDLRQPLYKIFSQHALGSMKRVGRAWKTFDVLEDYMIMQTPYSFELDTHKSDVKTSENLYEWKNLTWQEAEKLLEQSDIAILPVGAIEQHGPHLPLDIDTFDAIYLANKVAEACSEPKPLVVPAIPYGVSYHHDNFKGTISIQNNTLSQIIYDIGVSLARNGIKKLVIINGHGGNVAALNHAAQMINRDTHIFVCVDTGETSDTDIYTLISTPNDVHAGEVETSTALAIRPHLVKMDLAEASIPNFSNNYLNFTSKRGIPWYAYTEKISHNGVMGDPTKATAAKGEKIWNIMIAHLVNFIEELKGFSIEDMRQKGY